MTRKYIVPEDFWKSENNLHTLYHKGAVGFVERRHKRYYCAQVFVHGECVMSRRVSSLRVGKLDVEDKIREVHP